ncbi:MAG: glycosyltransferase family 2 protein [Planctomycetes bacterium]|nr:glycosyltransferase family 2 protein [Planctomycetota bacterium]
MRVSVIIVTFSQHDLLRICLRSAQRAMQSVDGEIIVVDNASTDATPKVVEEEFPGVRLIRNPVNLYYTRAVNQGMRAAKGEFVYLLNDDTELEPANITELLQFMQEHPKCGVVGPMLRSPQHEYQVSAQQFPTPIREILGVFGIAHWLRNRSWSEPIQKRYSRHPLPTRRVDWVCGGAIFLRRRLMEELGHHDEHYLFYCDDPDIGMRSASAGYEVWYLDRTYVLHHHGLSTVKTPRKLRFDIILTRSRRHYLRKFHGWLGMAAVEAAYGAASLLRAAKALLTGRREKAVKHWLSLRCQFEACRMPPEEKQAIDGYASCIFNGLGVPSPNVHSPQAQTVQ